MRKVLLLLLLLLVLSSSVYAGPYDNWQKWTKDYHPEVIDVDKHWAFEQIMGFLTEDFVRVDKGYRTPNDYYFFIDHEGRFRPDEYVTRAEMLKFIDPWSGPTADLGEPWPEVPESQFTDVHSHWVGERGFLYRAIEHGIVVPSDYWNKEFNPDQTVSRLEAAILVLRYKASELGELDNEATEQKIKEWVANASDTIPFKDREKIPVWARGFIQAAYEQGLLVGYPDKTYKPDAPITRVEVMLFTIRARE